MPLLRFPALLCAISAFAFGQPAAPVPGPPVTGPTRSASDAAAATPVSVPKAAAQKAEPASPAALPPPAVPTAIYLTWQRDPTTTMTIHWHTVWTEAYADSAIEYRTVSTGDWSRGTGRAQPFPFTDRMVHTVELSGLAANTSYEFRFGRLVTREPDGALLFQPHGAVYKFRTLPATLSRPVRFMAGGDAYGGDNAELLSTMCRAGASRDPEFAMLGGDIAYVNDEPKAAHRWFEFFRVWGATMKTTDGHLIPIVPAIGNHEVHGDTYQIRGGAPNRGVSPDRAIYFYTLFSFPGRPGYNVLDIGNYLSLVALDSFHSNPVPGPQTDWLRSTLEKRGAVPFIVPFYHVPAYPSHRAFSGAISVAIRANWVPLFDAAGVRFAFEHHDHTYKVTHPLRGGQRDPTGTRYLGDGAWAVNTRPVHTPDQATYLERAQGRNHAFIVTLHPGRAEFSAVDPTGAEFDQFTINAKK